MFSIDLWWPSIIGYCEAATGVLTAVLEHFLINDWYWWMYPWQFLRNRILLHFSYRNSRQKANIPRRCCEKRLPNLPAKKIANLRWFYASNMLQYCSLIDTTDCCRLRHRHHLIDFSAAVQLCSVCVVCCVLGRVVGCGVWGVWGFLTSVFSLPVYLLSSQ